jgi:hypothetical protein
LGFHHKVYKEHQAYLRFKIADCRRTEAETVKHFEIRNPKFEIRLSVLLRGYRALGLGHCRSGVCRQPLPIELDNSFQEKQQRLAYSQLGLPPVFVLKELHLAMAADRA